MAVIERTGEKYSIWSLLKHAMGGHKGWERAWRDPNNFGLKESLALVENMRLAVEAAHQAGAVLVDANEMNYLAQKFTRIVMPAEAILSNAWRCK